MVTLLNKELALGLRQVDAAGYFEWLFLKRILAVEDDDIQAAVGPSGGVGYEVKERMVVPAVYWLSRFPRLYVLGRGRIADSETAVEPNDSQLADRVLTCRSGGCARSPGH